MSPPIFLLLGLCAAVAVAIVGGIVVAGQLDSASVAQVRLAAAREDLEAMLRSQLFEDIGMRGYVASGQRYFLEPNGPPSETFEGRAGRLEAELDRARITNGRPLVEDILATHREWESRVALPLLHARGRSDAIEKQTYGKLLTDRMRVDAATLRDALHAAGDEVQASLRLRINATVAASVGIITAFAVVALLLGFSRARALAAFEREHVVAAALQETLRVPPAPLPGAAIGSAYTSATREALVGGDLIDTWRIDGERGWLLIADASGKGISAARTSAFVQFALRALCAGQADPAAVLERFNRLFMDTFEDPGGFVVVFLALVDAAAGTMRYAAAGHATAFVRRGDAVEQLPPTGPIVGLGRDETFAARSVALAPGDLVMLATDGLTESRDAAGDMLGDDGAMRLLQEHSRDPQAICDMLVAEVERRSRGEVSDDLAILVVRMPGGDVPNAAAGARANAPSSNAS